MAAFAATTSSRNRAASVSICTSFASTTPKRSVAGSNTRKRNRAFWQIDSRYLPIGGFGGLGGNGSGGGVGVGVGPGGVGLGGDGVSCMIQARFMSSEVETSLCVHPSGNLTRRLAGPRADEKRQQNGCVRRNDFIAQSSSKRVDLHFFRVDNPETFRGRQQST